MSTHVMQQAILKYKLNVQYELNVSTCGCFIALLYIVCVVNFFNMTIIAAEPLDTSKVKVKQ